MYCKCSENDCCDTEILYPELLEFVPDKTTPRMRQFFQELNQTWLQQHLPEKLLVRDYWHWSMLPQPSTVKVRLLKKKGLLGLPYLITPLRSPLLPQTISPVPFSHPFSEHAQYLLSSVSCHSCSQSNDQSRYYSCGLILDAWAVEW